MSTTQIFIAKPWNCTTKTWHTKNCKRFKSCSQTDKNTLPPSNEKKNHQRWRRPTTRPSAPPSLPSSTQEKKWVTVSGTSRFRPNFRPKFIGIHNFPPPTGRTFAGEQNALLFRRFQHIFTSFSTFFHCTYEIRVRFILSTVGNCLIDCDANVDSARENAEKGRRQGCQRAVGRILTARARLFFENSNLG